MESTRQNLKASSSKSISKIDDDEVKIISALVVDDVGFIRLIHKTILEGLKIWTEIAKNGQEAVDMCETKKFDIIFMDKEMPIMDGVEATKELREMGVKSMIVGITSKNSDKENWKFLAAGLDQCFEKPLTRAMVQAILPEL